MKTLFSIITACLFAAFIQTSHAKAQQPVESISNEDRGKPVSENNLSGSSTSSAFQVDSLRQRRLALSSYLETVDPSSDDYDRTVSAIRQLDVQLYALVSNFAVTTAHAVQLAPKFDLSTPGDNLTNESVQPVLSWTEDQNPAPRPTIQKYIVNISDDENFNTIVYTAEVNPRPHPLTIQHTVPEGFLEKGVTYHWQVFAVYTLTAGSPTLTAPAQKAFSFTTARSIFKRFSDKGFSLQRVVEGPDAGKGAEFSFLRTLGKSTVYTADFALIYDRRLTNTSRTHMSFQTSVEGKLTSDESESENAWRFRAGTVIDRLLQPNTLNLMYLALGGKFEGSQDFEVKKMTFEALFTPTFPDLLIGVSKPLDTASPFQFRWRPFIGVDAGRTIRRGSSRETKDTVFRLTPRVTAKLKLNFLNEVLKLNEVYVWLDNIFYYLPLESKTKRNFFSSGLEFELTDNLGFGLTYKNGEAAPKFNRVNTLGGTISIRFGRDDQ